MSYWIIDNIFGIGQTIVCGACPTYNLKKKEKSERDKGLWKIDNSDYSMEENTPQR